RRRKFAWKRLIGEPVEAIVEIELGAGGDRVGRYPHSNHVVVDLVVRRNFAQLDRPVAPALAARAWQRLNPEARAPIVKHAIEIMIEYPVALEEPKTTWVVVGKS